MQTLISIFKFYSLRPQQIVMAFGREWPYCKSLTVVCFGPNKLWRLMAEEFLNKDKPGNLVTINYEHLVRWWK